MKKYIQPESTLIKMNMESAILSASEFFGIQGQESDAGTLSNMRDMWGNSSIWD